MAFFLIVAGLSGSVLAFNNELGQWLNPPEKVAIANTQMLDPFTLRERALSLEPHGRINTISLKPLQPGEMYTAVFEPPSEPTIADIGWLASVKLNPYTGAAILRQTIGPGQGSDSSYWPLTRKNILPMIAELHYSLLLGDVGVWLFGIAAMVWTIDCFVGFYLTLPPPKKNSPPTQRFTSSTIKTTTFSSIQHSFWQRWQVAWKIKWPSSIPRINFDLHRAGGLWTWPMLLVFAWSSVYLNLLEPVYTPVMKAFFTITDFKDYPKADLKQAQADPALDFRTAYQIGKRLMAEQAFQKNFTVLEEQQLLYDPQKGLYLYWVATDRDISKHAGSSLLWFDADQGNFIALYLPTGEKSGDTLTNWLGALHMARIGGLPYKLWICFMGLVVPTLSVTGVYLWLQKRRAANLKRYSRSNTS